MLMLQETKLENMEYNIVQSLWADENFEWVSIASKGKARGLITMWDKSIFKIEQSINMDCCLVVVGVWVMHDFRSVMCNIYAPNVAGERKNL